MLTASWSWTRARSWKSAPTGICWRGRACTHDCIESSSHWVRRRRSVPQCNPGSAAPARLAREVLVRLVPVGADPDVDNQGDLEPGYRGHELRQLVGHQLSLRMGYLQHQLVVYLHDER